MKQDRCHLINYFATAIGTNYLKSTVLKIDCNH